MRLKILMLILILIFGFSEWGLCGAYDAERKVIKEAIEMLEKMPNIKQQPTSIGEVFYSDSKTINERGLTWGECVTYTYLGIENNAVKVKFDDFNSLFERDDETILYLPLNKNKQTLLKVKGGKYLDKVELIITVIDEFNRIKAEKFNK